MRILDRKLLAIMTPTPQGGGPVLPDTYQQVEFIDAFGNAYINTGITSSDNTKIVMECACTNVNSSNEHSRVQISAGTNPMIALNYSPATGNASCMFGSNWCYSTIGTLNTYEKTKFTIQQGSFTVEQNGVSKTDTFTAESITPGTIYLFRTSYDSTKVVTGRVWSLKIYDGNTLKRDYVPCYRKTDKELGFYDFVSETFFANANSVGAFSAKYLDIPSAYKQCYYIDSSSNQAIETGLKLGNKHRIEMNMQQIGDASNTVQAYFGAYDGSNNTYLGKGNSATYRMYYAHGSGSNQKYFDVGQAQFYTLKALSGDRTANFYINATNSTLTGNTYTNGATSYIFARHNKTSSTDIAAIPGTIRLYNLTVYLSGTRIKTYIPCYRVSDDVAGVYELNSGTFLSSITGTELIKGTDI